MWKLDKFTLLCYSSSTNCSKLYGLWHFGHTTYFMNLSWSIPTCLWSKWTNLGTCTAKPTLIIGKMVPRQSNVVLKKASTVFHIRDRSRVKNLTATATWPDTDKNNNRLTYSYKLKYYTLCDPPEKLHDPLPKKINRNTWRAPDSTFCLYDFLFNAEKCHTTKTCWERFCLLQLCHLQRKI